MTARQIQVLIANVLLAAAMLAAPALAQVPYQRIVRAAETPADWLTYNGNYNSQRYSALSQINRQNVGQLRPLWMYQIKRPGVFEASPIVADGVMYISEPPSRTTTTAKPATIERDGRNDNHGFHRMGFSTISRLTSAKSKAITTIAAANAEMAASPRRLFALQPAYYDRGPKSEEFSSWIVSRI